MYCTGAVTHSKAKMYYQNFDSHITRAYRIVLEGWPLPKFCSPSDIGSLMEVQLLYESWKSGATSFRRLADGEWKTWLERDFEGRMDDMENGEKMPLTVWKKQQQLTTGRQPTQVKRLRLAAGLRLVLQLRNMVRMSDHLAVCIIDEGLNYRDSWSGCHCTRNCTRKTTIHSGWKFSQIKTEKGHSTHRLREHDHLGRRTATWCREEGQETSLG